MAGLIKTAPSADNIIQGGSRLLIKFGSDAVYYHAGRIKNLQSTPNITNRDVFNAMDGSPKRVKRRTNMTSVTHEFVTIEMSNRIVRAWLMGGNESAVTQAAATAVTQTIGAITGAAAGADVLLGVYYPLSKKLVSNPAWTGKVLGTDFLIEPKTGAIAFLTAVVDGDLTDDLTFDCAGIAGTSFQKFASLTQTIAAKIIHTYEDGSHHDADDIPLGKLIPKGSYGTGDDGSEQGKDQELSFTIEQEFDDVAGWGSFSRLAAA